VVSEQPNPVRLSPVPLTPSAYLAHLERAATTFADVLQTGDLDAPVPDCPGWRLVDLAHHLGGVHRWANTAIVEGRRASETVDDAPTERAALVDWFRDGAETLTSTLQRTEPTTPCWTFGPRPRTAAFWFRRQAHETALHTRDAAISQGEPLPLASDLALDGIDEVVRMFFPGQVRLGRIPPLPATLALETTEGARWVLAGDGTGSETDAAATVRGPAEAVLLLLWHRTTLDDHRLAVSGPRELAESVLSSALAP
jgi:uncharacterized protein (TIGR03083 family)